MDEKCLGNTALNIQTKSPAYCIQCQDYLDHVQITAELDNNVLCCHLTFAFPITLYYLEASTVKILKNNYSNILEIIKMIWTLNLERLKSTILLY